MASKESNSRTETPEEISNSSILRNIPKDDFLQAPEGYFDQLNLRIIDRIRERENSRSSKVEFNWVPFIQWTGVAAVITIFTIFWTTFKNEVGHENTSQTNTNQILIVELPDSVLIESLEMQAIDEQVFADELISSPPAQSTNSVIPHDQLTEYLLLHVDHDLLIESL